MSKQELYNRLLKDLNKLGVDTDCFDLSIRGYSKTYFGTYNPNNNKISLYVYPYKDSVFMYPYKDLFKTLLHEVSHYLQYQDPFFIRYKGIMHNKEFYLIYNKLISKSIKRGILRKEDTVVEESAS